MQEQVGNGVLTPLIILISRTTLINDLDAKFVEYLLVELPVSPSRRLGHILGKVRHAHSERNVRRGVADYQSGEFSREGVWGLPLAVCKWK